MDGLVGGQRQYVLDVKNKEVQRGNMYRTETNGIMERWRGGINL